VGGVVGGVVGGLMGGVGWILGRCAERGGGGRLESEQQDERRERAREARHGVGDGHEERGQREAHW
jgi:hypothetical protein